MAIKKKSLYLVVFFLFGVTSLFSQVRLPQPSPTVKLIQNFGISEIVLDYSRPSLRGRSFGEGNLNYYGKFWRTGANAATNITLGSEISVNGKKLPAGKYGLYSIPDKNEWTIIFSKNTSVTDISAYKAEDDVLTLKVKPEVHSLTETFTIDFTDFTINSMVMSIKWDKFSLPIKVETPVKDQVLATTDKEISKFANSLTQAANFAFENNEIEKGKIWLDESLELQENFVNLHLKSKILAKEGSFTEAVNTAEKSLDLAKEAKNEFYVSENEKYINEWRPKMTTQRGKKK